MNFIPYSALDPETVSAMATQFQRASPTVNPHLAAHYATKGVDVNSEIGASMYRQLGSPYGARGTPFPFGKPPGYQGGSGGMYPAGSGPAFNDLLQALMGRRQAAAGAKPSGTFTAWGGNQPPSWLPPSVTPTFPGRVGTPRAGGGGGLPSFGF